ncbi:putative prophage protein [Escherichia coli]|nr:putative prophage protein [Escherichia coli]
MKQKNSGFTASGLPRPEFMNSDIYRDKYGGMVMIKGVAVMTPTY